MYIEKRGKRREYRGIKRKKEVGFLTKMGSVYYYLLSQHEMACGNFFFPSIRGSYGVFPKPRFYSYFLKMPESVFTPG